MALITRFTRLFRADLHAVLDRVEEPDVLLRQAVREMEEDITRDEQRHKVLNHELARVGARRSDLKQSVDQINEEMDICFGSDQEALARGLVKRKLEAQQLLKALARKHQSLTDSAAALDVRLDDNRERLQAMRQKAELLAEDDTGHREEPWGLPHVTVRDADVEVAFLREKRQRSLS